MDDNEVMIDVLKKENELIIKNYKMKYEGLLKEIENLKIELKQQIEEKNNIQKQLDSILYSRSYKITRKIIGLIKKEDK